MAVLEQLNADGRGHMRILVTGGTGLIGSHLVKLLKPKHDLVILSRHTVKTNNARMQFIKGDVTNYSTVEKSASGCDVVFHLAAQTDIALSFKKPKLDYKINVEGTKNVLKACKSCGIDRLVFTSTAAVYGYQRFVPIKETAIKKSTSPYGKNKLIAEKLCDKFGSFIVRPFNVYDESDRSYSNINKFCSLIKSDKKITIDLNRHDTRDYIHASDVGHALLFGLKDIGTYNVGTGVETSFPDLIALISGKLNKQAKVVYQGDDKKIRRSCADISKIMHDFRWMPIVRLEDGVERIVKN